MAQFSGHSLTGGDKEIFPYRDVLLTPVHVRTVDSSDKLKHNAYIVNENLVQIRSYIQQKFVRN
jgi:hypothetical protein